MEYILFTTLKMYGVSFYSLLITDAFNLMKVTMKTYRMLHMVSTNILSSTIF